MEELRTVQFRPYRWNQPGREPGPRFVLRMFDTHRQDARGQTIIAYTFTEYPAHHQASVVVFEGDTFAGSPLHADDSDATVAALMGFITLRPGDTDRAYFDEYSQAQLDFADQHAEALAIETAEHLRKQRV